MKDLAAAVTIFFVTLGPVKVIPPFFLLTHDKDQRTIWSLAFKATIVSSAIVLFVALVVSGLMEKWRVSVDAIAIAGGIMLLIASIKAVGTFALIDTPPAQGGGGEGAANNDARPISPALKTPWLGRPVLSPIAIPTIIPPIGVAAILFYADAALDDDAYKLQLVGALLGVMALNFVAMILAGPIMRIVGIPILQTIGWLAMALQAGLAVQVIIEAIRRLHMIP